jgi:hypothetical protein
MEQLGYSHLIEFFHGSVEGSVPKGGHAGYVGSVFHVFKE